MEWETLAVTTESIYIDRVGAPGHEAQDTSLRTVPTLGKWAGGDKPSKGARGRKEKIQQWEGSVIREGRKHGPARI